MMYLRGDTLACVGMLEVTEMPKARTPWGENVWKFASHRTADGRLNVYLFKWTRGEDVVWESPVPGVPAPDLESAPDLPWQVAEFVLEHYRNKVQLAPMRYGWFGLVQQRKEDE